MTAITFPKDYSLEERSIKLVQGVIGLYFIRLESLRILYPFTESRLIYIGMSESTYNSIGRRLRGHLTGQSGNYGIMNYAARYQARFTYLLPAPAESRRYKPLRDRELFPRRLPPRSRRVSGLQ
jgi:hypothetical protein